MKRSPYTPFTRVNFTTSFENGKSALISQVISDASDTSSKSNRYGEHVNNAHSPFTPSSSMSSISSPFSENSNSNNNNKYTTFSPSADSSTPSSSSSNYRQYSPSPLSFINNNNNGKLVSSGIDIRRSFQDSNDLESSEFNSPLTPQHSLHHLRHRELSNASEDDSSVTDSPPRTAEDANHNYHIQSQIQKQDDSSSSKRVEILCTLIENMDDRGKLINKSDVQASAALKRTHTVENPGEMMQEILASKRNPHIPFTYPVPYIEERLKEKTVIDGKFTTPLDIELAHLIESHELLTRSLISYHCMMNLYIIKNYTEPEEIDRDCLRQIYDTQSSLFPLSRIGHRCTENNCERPACIKGSVLTSCMRCGCDTRSFLPGQKYFSCVTGLTLEATGNVYVCRKSGAIHICGQYCKGSAISPETQEIICSFTGIFKEPHISKGAENIKTENTRRIVAEDASEVFSGMDCDADEDEDNNNNSDILDDFPVDCGIADFGDLVLDDTSSSSSLTEKKRAMSTTTYFDPSDPNTLYEKTPTTLFEIQPKYTPTTLVEYPYPEDGPVYEPVVTEKWPGSFAIMDEIKSRKASSSSSSSEQKSVLNSFSSSSSTKRKLSPDFGSDEIEHGDDYENTKVSDPEDWSDTSKLSLKAILALTSSTSPKGDPVVSLAKKKKRNHAPHQPYDANNKEMTIILSSIGEDDKILRPVVNDLRLASIEMNEKRLASEDVGDHRDMDDKIKECVSFIKIKTTPASKHHQKQDQISPLLSLKLPQISSSKNKPYDMNGIHHLVNGCMMFVNDFITNTEHDLKNKVTSLFKLVTNRENKKMSDVSSVYSMFKSREPKVRTIFNIFVCLKKMDVSYCTELRQRLLTLYTEKVASIYEVFKDDDRLLKKTQDHKLLIQYLMLSIASHQSYINSSIPINTSFIDAVNMRTLPEMKKQMNFDFLEKIGLKKAYGGYHTITF